MEFTTATARPPPIDTQSEETAAAASASDVAAVMHVSSNVLKSPVPLNSEEEASAEVRALAEALAPALVAADELMLQGTMEFQRSSNNYNNSESGVGGDDTIEDDDDDDDDDDLDDEVEALGASEALLRQELELAQDFSNLFAFSVIEDSNESSSEQISGYESEEPVVMIEEEEEHSSPVVHHDSSATEADLDGEDEEVVDDKLQPIRIPQPTPTKDAALTTPDRLGGDSFFASPSRQRGSAPIHYTASEHCTVLGLHKEEHGGWYSVSLARHLGISTSEDGGDDADVHHLLLNDAVKEYCLSVPDSKLRQLYVGLPEPYKPGVIDDSTPAAAAAAAAATVLSTSKAAKPTTQAPTLPVRTIAMRIRPDVLCGAVMEAVHHALIELDARVTKRQGGHIQAVMRRAKCGVENNETQPEQSYYPPYFVDARLATCKSDNCERMLLLRVYHVTDAIAYDDADDVDEASRQDLFIANSHGDMLVEPDNDMAALHLREAAALIQRIETLTAAKRINPSGSLGNLTRHAVTEMVSAYLMGHYRACPSVKLGGITLPALNAEDFRIIQSSWRLIQSVWEELETRDLAYTTLRTSRFGSFPSLPTVDVHYCSQIRRISREAMTVQLVKTASELEQYAREAELACANMITLLKPTFETYGVVAPSLPKPKQLTEYPLDFIVPQASCPPWGVKVQHALNEIQAWTGIANKDDPVVPLSHEHNVDPQKSLEMAASAVQLVLEAFHKQDDEEQSARLGRKNVQVMDRLAKMQSHQHLSIQTLQNCTNVSDVAVIAANGFKGRSGVREVPLLKWGIVVGRSTGTCTITANHILFVTQLIPVLGGNKTTLYKLEDVDFSVEEVSTSLLNPLPTIVHVTQRGREIYSFRPSIGGARLKSFLDVIKTAAAQAPLNFPEQDLTATIAHDEQGESKSSSPRDEPDVS